MRSPALAFLLIGLFFVNAARAQSKELLIQGQTGKLYLLHTVAAKETWYSIGRMYNTGPKAVAGFNSLDMDKPLNIGQEIEIPLGAVNFSQTAQKTAGETLLPVYHLVQEKEWMYRISVNHNKVPIGNLEKWNHITKDQVKAGMYLVVGFLQVKTALSALAKDPPPAPVELVTGSGSGVPTGKSDTTPTTIRQQPAIKKADAVGAPVGQITKMDVSTKTTTKETAKTTNETAKMEKEAGKTANETGKTTGQTTTNEAANVKTNTTKKEAAKLTTKTTTNETPKLTTKETANETAKATVNETTKATAAGTTKGDQKTEPAVKETTKTFNGGYFRTDFTDGGKSVTGTAGTFKSSSGWQDGKYYALMNNVAVGTIVRIGLPSTDKTVFVKVLGPLPDMKESVGLTVRISNAAASELGEPEGRFNVEAKY